METFMKISPEWQSSCLDYLARTKDIYDRRQLLQIGNDFLFLTAFLEEEDFNKASRILLKHKKVKEAKTIAETFKERHFNKENILSVWRFMAILRDGATSRKQTETKKAILSEISKEFPQYEEIIEIQNYISQIQLMPFHKINILEEAEKLKIPEQQLNALKQVL